MTPLRFCLTLALLLIVSGCTLPRPQTDPALDKAAKKAALDARALNQDIQTSKGTGWLRLDSWDRTEKYRIAWAAGYPNRLRIIFLVSGMPVETLAATGDIVTFVSHTQRHKPHTAVSNDPDLERYIHVPVRLSDMVALLLGRVPVRPFDDAWFVPWVPGGVPDRSRIKLIRHFRTDSQELVVTPDNLPQVLRLRNREDKILYEIQYRSWREQGGFSTPSAMTVNDGRYRTVHLTLTDFQPNPPLKESVFRLTATGS